MTHLAQSSEPMRALPMLSRLLSMVSRCSRRSPMTSSLGFSGFSTQVFQDRYVLSDNRFRCNMFPTPWFSRSFQGVFIDPSPNSYSMWKNTSCLSHFQKKTAAFGYSQAEAWKCFPNFQSEWTSGWHLFHHQFPWRKHLADDPEGSKS